MVATLGRWSELEATLQRLNGCEPPQGWEIVVVSDGGGALPTDPAFDRVIGLMLPHRGAAAARNAGAAVARGRVLVFVDDDVHPTPEWGAALGSFIDSSTLAATGPVSARDLTVLSRARSLRYIRRYRRVRCGQSVDFFAGGNGVVRRAAFLDAGGFPVSGVGADNELATGLAEPPRFCWGLHVTHRNDRGFRTAIITAFTSGSADARRRRSLGRPVIDRADVCASAVNAVLFAIRTVGWLGGRAWAASR